MSHTSNPNVAPEAAQRTDDVSYLSDWRMADSIGTAVVLSVADHTDSRPVDLPLLSTAIDPDGLDQLLEDGDRSVSVSFSYAGCRLSLRGDGKLTIQ